MIDTVAVCQSCCQRPAVVTEKTDDPSAPFLLCQGCHRRLLAYALRPKEWYNLASLHGWWQFYLHDDFYDEEGNASQPDEPVTDAELFPVPPLQAVASSLGDLFGYALTRWTIRPDLVSAMRQYPAAELLGILNRRLADTKDIGIVATIFVLCGEALGPEAAAFVREKWSEYVTIVLHPLLLAAAKCLPTAEGFSRATTALAQLDEEKRREAMSSLAWFGSPLALDWIEQNVGEPIIDSWGILAASSQLDWQRVERWLGQGRPLSHVALVGLAALTRHPRYLTAIMRKQEPRLLCPPSEAVFLATLEEYQRRDPAPRVKQLVSFLSQNAMKLWNS